MDGRELSSELQSLKEWYSKRVVYFNKLQRMLKPVCCKEKQSSQWVNTFLLEHLRAASDNLEEHKFAWCVFYHVVPNLLFTADSLKAYRARVAEASGSLDVNLQRALRQLPTSEAPGDAADNLQKLALSIRKYMEICDAEATKAFRSGGRRNVPSVLELQLFGKRGAGAFQVEVVTLNTMFGNGSTPPATEQDTVVVDCKMNTTVQECTILVASKLGISNPSMFTLFVHSSKGSPSSTSSWYPLHPCLFMADVVAEQARYLGLPPPTNPDHPPSLSGVPFLFKAFVLPASNPKAGLSATMALLLRQQCQADEAAGLALQAGAERCEHLPFRVDILSLMSEQQPLDSVPPGSSAILAVSTSGLQLVSRLVGELLSCSVQEVASLDVCRNRVTINSARCQVVLECHPKQAQGMWTTWQAVLFHAGRIEELRAYGVGSQNTAKQRALKVHSKDPSSPSPPDTPPPGFMRAPSMQTPSGGSTPTAITPLARTASGASGSSAKSVSHLGRAATHTRRESLSPEVSSAPASTSPYAPKHRYTRQQLLELQSLWTTMPHLLSSEDGPHMQGYVESPMSAHTSSSPSHLLLLKPRRSSSLTSSGRFSPCYPSSPTVAPGLSPTTSGSSSILTPTMAMVDAAAAAAAAAAGAFAAKAEQALPAPTAPQQQALEV